MGNTAGKNKILTANEAYKITYEYANNKFKLFVSEKVLEDAKKGWITCILYMHQFTERYPTIDWVRLDKRSLLEEMGYKIEDSNFKENNPLITISWKKLEIESTPPKKLYDRKYKSRSKCKDRHRNNYK